VLRILLRAIRATLRRASPGAGPDAQLGAVSFLHRFVSALRPEGSDLEHTLDLDQTPAFDPAEPEPAPDTEFDQDRGA
jgi:hypothetical protein